jgi:hypothetical protein
VYGLRRLHATADGRRSFVDHCRSANRAKIGPFIQGEAGGDYPLRRQNAANRNTLNTFRGRDVRHLQLRVVFWPQGNH